MSDELDINLPQDADDLSKHAPTLFSLKNAEEVFVVPALYFEELSEQVISKTAIPLEGGLVVPENYFEESADLIFAKVNFPSEDGLTAPAEYFEELPGLIEAKTILPAESGLTDPEKYFEEFGSKLDSQIALEHVLPKSEGEVPEGYFDQMENELHVHIALDNVKQDDGFLVPDGYFEHLPERLVALDSARSDKDASTDDPNVPEKYFEELPEKVIARIESEEKSERGKVIVFAEWKRYIRPTALAASVALMIGLTWYFVVNRDNGQQDLVAKFEKVTPEHYSPSIDVAPDAIDTTIEGREVPVLVADNLPNDPNDFKPKQVNEVIMNEAEIIAQSDLMEESLVMDFVAESEMIQPSEEVLDTEMMEYLMNDDAGLNVLDPVDINKP